VIGAFVVFLASGDDEIAVFDVGVGGAICVGLELVVAPAATAEVVGPFFGVGSGAIGGVEFVGPDEGEIFERGGISGFGLIRLRGGRRSGDGSFILARRAWRCGASTDGESGAGQREKCAEYVAGDYARLRARLKEPFSLSIFFWSWRMA
jgi:hypothetical protein